ncbi:hypothetical protein P280DRAFT_472962 [Massarina eburnea CBS 473.64]|uniref:N-acetyltransferase domain-containing protein n=1 Tax=Massarina eburnea CBS 473.64 TaxID=1395130 RepID=A0A6A6RMD8_9PLEO|nr:hypothetical protein P280DRAFT_472962 [Massarina eburnea CBS 473.64]
MSRIQMSNWGAQPPAMRQSSITAWLKKPPSVTPEPPSETRETRETRETLATSKFTLPPLPANVELVPLTDDLMPAFKRLLVLTLPIPYPPAFFAETMQKPFHGLTLLAVWQSTPPKTTANNANTATRDSGNSRRVVGAIRCRILPSSMLYISTISLLAPYRSHGIASHLLYNIVTKAAKEHGVTRVTAHVWEANEDGLEWYAKRGFEVVGKEDSYYSKLKPAGAVLVLKPIGVADLLAVKDAAGARDG